MLFVNRKSTSSYMCVCVHIFPTFLKCMLDKICIHFQFLDFMFESATKWNEQFFQISFLLFIC